MRLRIYTKDKFGRRSYLQLVPDSIDKDGKSQIDIGAGNIGMPSEYDVWTVEKIEIKKYRIKNEFKGAKACYLTACGTPKKDYHIACTPDNCGEGKENQFWEPAFGKDHKYQLKSKDGYYLDFSNNKVTL